MNLFYLDDWSGCKSQRKKSKSLPRFNSVLQTTPQTKEPVYQDSFQLVFEETLELREFKCETREIPQKVQEKLLQVKENIKKILDFTEKIKTFQGQNDEILSRFCEQNEKLKSLVHLFESKKCENEKIILDLKIEVEKAKTWEGCLEKQKSEQENKKNLLKCINLKLLNDTGQIFSLRDQILQDVKTVQNHSKIVKNQILLNSETIRLKKSEILFQVAISSELESSLNSDMQSISRLNKKIEVLKRVD